VDAGGDGSKLGLGSSSFHSLMDEVKSQHPYKSPPHVWGRIVGSVFTSSAGGVSALPTARWTVDTQ